MMPTPRARNSNRRPLRWPGLIRAAAIGLSLLTAAGDAQQTGTHKPDTAPQPGSDALAQPPRAWAEAGAACQEHIISADDEPIRYRIRKVDARGDITREVIESRDGSVARVIERNGAPLTAEENDAERERLNDILSSPDSFLRRHRREHAGREYALELVHAMPPAMLWSYAPGQPQPPNAPGTQVVLDFRPDPRYKPPTLITEGLTGIAGRLWVDQQSHCVTRIQGKILHPVDFGWGGLLARVREGGTVELEQSHAGGHRWFYSHLSEHVTLREMMVHTVSEDNESSAWNVHLLDAPVSIQDAIHELLALPVQTH